jgi:Mrp family chromosome partitioning ATPase
MIEIISSLAQGAMKTPASQLEAELHEALLAIKHPEIRTRTLGELGVLQSIQVIDNNVRVTLALPLQQTPVNETLVARVEQAVQGITPQLQTNISVTRMAPEQRAVFMAAARGDARAVTRIQTVACVIAVMSGKGGVGKSAITGMLATSLRRRGLRTGILDADITGPSIPRIFGLSGSPDCGPDGILPVVSRTGIRLMSINLLLREEDQAVIWRGPLISRAIEQFWKDIAWGDLDYLVVDLPPGTSDAALTVTQSLPLHGVVLVTSPQDLAGMVVRKAADLVRQMEVSLIGVIENMSHVICPQCGTALHVFGPSRAGETAHLIGSDLLGHLPLDPNLAMLCDAGEIEEYRSEAFEAVVDKVLQRLPRVAER